MKVDELRRHLEMYPDNADVGLVVCVNDRYIGQLPISSSECYKVHTSAYVTLVSNKHIYLGDYDDH